jgi:hypothetical protein
MVQASPKVAPKTPKNDACKEVTTSKDVAVIQSGKQDLSFHPGVMVEDMSGLHNNASKEEMRCPQATALSAPTKSGKTFVRRQATTASTGLSRGQPKTPDEHRPPTKEMTPSPTEACPAAHAARA